jgi:hypothetical protein
MEKTVVLFLFFIFTFGGLNMAIASQIESNHSYFRNSNFVSDYEITLKGYGDFKLDTFKFGDNVTNETNTDFAVNFDVQGKIEEGFKYGLQLIKRFNDRYTKNTSYFIYTSNAYGRFELGNTSSATDISRIGGDSVSIGNGGIFGDFSRQIISNLPNNQFFILKEGTLSNQFFGYYNNNMNMDYYDYFNYKGKINYFSPEFFGFQALFSYMPNNEIRIGEINITNATNNMLNIGDIMSLGVNYINSFDNLGIAVSFVLEQNGVGLFSNKNNNIEITEELEISSKIISGSINYFGFTLSASYGTLKREKVALQTFKTITDESAKYLNYSAGYEISNISLNFNNFKSEMGKKNVFSSTSYSLEVKTNKNVSFYGEYINFSLEDKAVPTDIKNYKGKMIMLGTLINFY